MRMIPILLALLAAGPLASAQEVTYQSLSEDAKQKKELEQGGKLIRKWYELGQKIDKGDTGAISRQEEALLDFRRWLDATEANLGVDLRRHPNVVLDVIDDGKIAILEKYRKGSIEYYDRDARGFGRGKFEYSVLVPKGYKPKEQRYPLVVTLHGRAIDPKHPAFKNKQNLFAQRGRKAIWNNWYRNAAGEEVVVVAPTGTPDGFKYEVTQHEDRQYDDRQALFLALDRGLTDYRTDWNRVFVEVHGPAVRLLIEQALLFAGLIVRDREDARRPILEPEDFYLLENLNGTPFCYIADEKMWDTVGKPFADALTEAYQKVGKPQNLVILKVPRDANMALQVDEGELKNFVTTHRLPAFRDKIVWRFPDPNFKSPSPIEVTGANFALRVNEAARKETMATLAGRMTLEVKREMEVTKIDVQITEAESLAILLHDNFVNLDHALTVTVNGKVVHDKVKVERDWTFFFENVLPRTYFMLPVVGRLDCAFDLKPQFVPPEEPKEEKPAETPPADDAAAGPQNTQAEQEKPPK